MLHNLFFSSTNLVIYPHLVLILSPYLICRRSLRNLCQPQPMHQVRRTLILTHETQDLHKIYEVPVLTILDCKVLKVMCCCNGGDIKGEVETPSSAAPTTAAPTPDAFEETYAELRKWADVTSPKFLLLAVKRERRAGRLGSAVKVCDLRFCFNFVTLIRCHS